MPKKVAPVPRGYHTVTPAIVVDDAAGAIRFYRKAFGAKERNRSVGPGGKIWHAEIQIGDSVVMVSDEFPEMGMKSAKTLGDVPGGLWLYVPNVDRVYRAAIKAGATSVREPKDEFWGDRMAIVDDPFGHTWSMATHRENVSPKEVERRRKAAVQEMGSADG